MLFKDFYIKLMSNYGINLSEIKFVFFNSSFFALNKLLFVLNMLINLAYFVAPKFLINDNHTL